MPQKHERAPPDAIDPIAIQDMSQSRRNGASMMTDPHSELIDHLHLRVGDLEASRRFYLATLTALGRTFTSHSDRHFACDPLWVDAADRQVSRVHLAFRAADQQEVDRFYAAAVGAGGTD